MKLKLCLLPLLILIASCDGDSSSGFIEQRVDVYIAKGDTQCNDNGLTLEETTSYLTSADIDVTESQCGVITDPVPLAVCGAQTNNIYIHTIELADLADAENLGFTETSAIEDDDSSYQIVKCQ